MDKALHNHAGWKDCTAEGAEIAVLRQGLTTSLRDKVRWLEESEAFSLQFPANRRRAVAEGRLERPQGS
jgi:hypothetical protein